MSDRLFRAAFALIESLENERLAEKIRPITRNWNYTDEYVENSLDAVRVRGCGSLKKFNVVSPSSSFGIEIIRDGSQYLKGDFDELSDPVAAYQEDSLYYVNVADISFQESLLIIVYVHTPITFQNIYAEAELINQP